MELQGDIRRVDQTLSKLLETFSGFLRDTDSKRVDVLINKESEIQSLRGEVQKKDMEKGALERQCSQLRERIDTLESQVARLKEKNNRLSDETGISSPDIYKIIKNVALDGVVTDPVLEGAIGELRVDKNLPVEICHLIEKYLKGFLNTDSSKLYDLIVECRDADLLDDDAIGLAHTIRKQRNFVLHEVGDEAERTQIARAIFCLFGAAMLLPKLPSKLRVTKD